MNAVSSSSESVKVNYNTLFAVVNTTSFVKNTSRVEVHVIDKDNESIEQFIERIRKEDQASEIQLIAKISGTHNIVGSTKNYLTIDAVSEAYVYKVDETAIVVGHNILFESNVLDFAGIDYIDEYEGIYYSEGIALFSGIAFLGQGWNATLTPILDSDLEDTLFY